MPERPRDSLGRPLPLDADPATAAPPVPSVEGLPDALVWQLAVSLLDDGMPFHAHEVFEQRWRLATSDDRGAWRAAAQWGAAATHAARGNDVGASRLALRAMATLHEAPAVPAAFDVGLMSAACAALAGGTTSPA
jgi:predicted metal-dependent hydrolase